MQLIYIAKVIDRTDFCKVVKSRAFNTHTSANIWGFNTSNDLARAAFKANITLVDYTFEVTRMDYDLN
jgi:hypothetical protein